MVSLLASLSEPRTYPFPPAAKWTLYEMPSRTGGNGYVLGSDKLANNETIGMVSETYGLILRLEPQAFFAQSLREADEKNFGPHEISLTVCSLRSKSRPGTVLIGGGEPMAWVLGKSTSNEAFAHQNFKDPADPRVQIGCLQGSAHAGAVGKV